MADELDDILSFYRQKDMSSGQYSYQHPTDNIVMPENSGALLTNMDIDVLGKRKKRKGYVIKADDLGTTAVNGLIGYSPVGGTKVLLLESNGTVYSWANTGNWASSKTGLTAATVTDFIIANGLCFRLGQTDNIWSFNGSTWTDEGGTTVEGGGSDAPKGKIGLWTSNQRLLLGNTSTNPNFLWPSDAGDPQTFGDAAFEFGQRDDKGVTGLVEFTDGEVIVFTKNSFFTWTITDTTTSNWVVKKVSDVGCVAQRSVKQMGQDVLFLSRDGVRTVVQSAQDKKRGESLPLSFPITDWVERINWGNAHKAVATVWNDKYILAVPIDGSTYNNYMFVFSRRAAETSGGGWTIYEGCNANAFAIQDFSDVRRLYFGEASGDTKAYLFRSDSTSEETTNDNGTAITYTEESKRIDFGSPEFDKTFNKLEVECIEQDSGTLTVQAQIDGENYTTIGTMAQTANLPTLPVDLPFDLLGGNKVRKTFNLESLGRGRNIQIKITEATLDAPVEMIGWSMSAFVENIEFE